MSKKKLKDNIFTYGLILMVLAIGVAVGTYAYYQSSVTGTVGGTVLAWDCSLGSSGVQATTFTSLYPGKNGEITFNVSASMPVTYQIQITGFTAMNSGTHANLKLYQTRTGTSPSYTFSSAITTSTVIEGSITGASGGTSSKTIYFNWPYGTTTEAYNSTQAKFNWQILCTQSQ